MKLNEISDFKKREIEYELRNEPDELRYKPLKLFNYGIYFDGKDKPWKVVGNENHANAIVKTLKSRGKNVEVRLTKQGVSEDLADSKKPDPVKKNMDKFHKPKTHKDMKAAQKRGYEKHKAKEVSEAPLIMTGRSDLLAMLKNYMEGFIESNPSDDAIEQLLKAMGKSIKFDKDKKRATIEAKAKKTRLDPKCWKGYKKQGTKIKGGVRVNNCVPK